MKETRVYLYPYAGPGGRNYLRQLGTLEDIQKQGVVLKEGLELKFYCDDADADGEPDNLVFAGKAFFDHDVDRWYVIVDESSYRSQSDD